MIFEQLNPGACKTYLIASERTQEAMLVDPLVGGVDEYVSVLGRRGLTLRYIVDTHVHADHVSGGAALSQRTGAPYLMHKNSIARCVARRVDEGDELSLGDIPIRFLHTPGHTQDSVTILLPDRILTGDFLFLGEGGAGRTDLPGGDPGEHWDALQKLAQLPGELLVFPGHDYHCRSSSTLARERELNERLRPRGKAEYVSWLNGLNLGPAEWMKEVIRANYACVTDARSIHIPADAPTCEVGGTRGAARAELVKLVTAEELARELDTPTPPILLDVREPSEYVGELGHIRGAKLIPLKQLGQSLAGLSSAKDARIVAVCKSGGRSAAAATLLTSSGFQDVRSLEGGMLRWNERRLPIDRTPPA